MNARIFIALSVLMLAQSAVSITQADSTITMQDAGGTPQAVIEVKSHFNKYVFNLFECDVHDVVADAHEGG